MVLTSTAMRNNWVIRFNMNILLRTYLIVGTLDSLLTIFTYYVTQNSPLVYVSILPTIFMLAIFIPIQRMINQINKKIKEQNGKCYNCNQIMDKDTATLEDNGHVYCKPCNRSLFPNKYYQGSDGIWYRNKEYDGK